MVSKHRNQVAARVSDSMLREIDQARVNDGLTFRSDAVRHLLSRGLASDFILRRARAAALALETERVERRKAEEMVSRLQALLRDADALSAEMDARLVEVEEQLVRSAARVSEAEERVRDHAHRNDMLLKTLAAESRSSREVPITFSVRDRPTLDAVAAFSISVGAVSVLLSNLPGVWVAVVSMALGGAGILALSVGAMRGRR